MPFSIYFQIWLKPRLKLPTKTLCNSFHNASCSSFLICLKKISRGFQRPLCHIKNIPWEKCVSPLKVGKESIACSLAVRCLFQDVGDSFPYNSFYHLHSSKAFKVHFLLCERGFFVLFLSSTVASQGRHYFVPVTERGSAGLQCSQTIDCLP